VTLVDVILRKEPQAATCAWQQGPQGGSPLPEDSATVQVQGYTISAASVMPQRRQITAGKIKTGLKIQSLDEQNTNESRYIVWETRQRP